MQCGIPNICLLVIGAGSSVGSAQFLRENVFTLGEQQYFVWDNAFQTKKTYVKNIGRLSLCYLLLRLWAQD